MNYHYLIEEQIDTDSMVLVLASSESNTWPSVVYETVVGTGKKINNCFSINRFLLTEH